MNDEIKKEPVPSILDMLADALALRIKAKIMEEIDQRIADSRQSIDADEVEGLDKYFENCMKDYERHGRKIDVDDIEGLDKAIEDVIKRMQM